MTKGKAIERVCQENPLGDKKIEYFRDKERSRHYRRIVGGIGWPSGVKPGCGVILAEDRNEDITAKKRIYHVLKEVEEQQLQKLLERCAELGSHYEVAYWYGDDDNKAAMELVGVVNRERKEHREKPLRISKAPLLDERRVFESYYLPVLHGRLSDRPKKALEIGSDSVLLARLEELQQHEVSTATPQEYPAIAALAYAVVHLEQTFHDLGELNRRQNAHFKKRYVDLSI